MRFLKSILTFILSWISALPRPTAKALPNNPKNLVLIKTDRPDFRTNTQNNFRKSISRFLIDVEHTNSDIKEYLKIVDPTKLKEFVEYIIHSHLPAHYKLIITIQVCAGGRINEILPLTKQDILLDEGLVRIRVLKKRTKKTVFRYAKISETVLPLLRKYILHLEGNNLFPVNRYSAYKYYRKMLGICTHALRHTFVSYLVQVEKWTPEQVMRFVQFEDIKDALVYYNTNTKNQSKTVNL